MLLPGLAQSVPDGMVTVDGQVYRALIDEPEPEPDPRARIVVQDRDVSVRWDGEVLRVRVTWVVRTKERAWFSQPLAGQSVRVDRVLIDGRPAKTVVQDRQTWVTTPIDGTVRVVLEGAVEGDPTRGPLSLSLLQAQIGRVRLSVPDGLEGTLAAPSSAVRTERLWIASERDLQVRVGPPARRARDRRTLAVGSVGMGLTVGDGAVDGRAQMRWTLRQGELRRVSFRVSGVGSDLEVTGSNVGRVERNGNQVVVTLREPETARLDLDVRWSVPVPPGETSQMPVPQITPDGVFRSEASIQIARDGSLDLLPTMNGWQPVSALDLPEWGDDLVTGTPTAAYRAGAAGKAGSLGLLRFVPASSPPVVVDVAGLTIATSAEGRTLVRALYTVRNERASHLAITPPTQATILGARVNDGPVTPVANGDGWLIPLPRSLETLDGLVSFPVEVVLLGDGEPWIRKETRELRLPRVDAPVAVNRVTLHLPPTFENELEAGEAGTVESFTEGEGIAYGFGLGGKDEAKADQLWQDAQSAFMGNEFDKADEIIEELNKIGAANENIGKLQSNLDVLQGRAGNKAKSVQARRVREQARSRGMDDYRKQEELLREAEAQLSSGSYDSAQQTYKEVAKMAEKLDKLEQEESYEQKARADLALKNVATASSNARFQLDLVETEDEEAPEESWASFEDGPTTGADRGEVALRGLLDSANGDGWLTQSADTGRVAGATGLKDRDGRLDWIPDPNEESAIVEMGEEIVYEFESDEVSGELFRAPDGDAVGEGVVRGLAGLGTKGTGSGGGGSRSGSEVMRVPAAEPEPERAMSLDVAESSSLSVRREIRTLGGSARGRGRANGVSIGGRRSGKKAKPKRAPKAAVAPPPPPPVASPSDISADLDDDADIVFSRDGLGPEDQKVADPSPDLAAVPVVPGGYEREALEVTSTRLSVVVPVQGQTLRYQQLLLPADAERAVRIEARSTDRHVPRRLP